MVVVMGRAAAALRGLLGAWCLGAATASGLGARLGSCCLALKLDVRVARAALFGLGGVKYAPGEAALQSAA
jgi:hypothetical protein